MQILCLGKLSAGIFRLSEEEHADKKIHMSSEHKKESN